MTQNPMKVSEAVQNIRMRMRQGILGADDYDDLYALLASHEAHRLALRVAGEHANFWLEKANVQPIQEDRHYCTVSIGFLRALSLAVEDASK